MKNQALFSSKDKSEKLKCCLLQFLFGAVCQSLVGRYHSQTALVFYAHGRRLCSN